MDSLISALYPPPLPCSPLTFLLASPPSSLLFSPTMYFSHTQHTILDQSTTPSPFSKPLHVMPLMSCAAAVPSRRDMLALIKAIQSELGSAAAEGDAQGGLLRAVCKEAVKAVQLVSDFRQVCVCVVCVSIRAYLSACLSVCLSVLMQYYQTSVPFTSLTNDDFQS